MFKRAFLHLRSEGVYSLQYFEIPSGSAADLRASSPLILHKSRLAIAVAKQGQEHFSVPGFVRALFREYLYRVL